MKHDERCDQLALRESSSFMMQIDGAAGSLQRRCELFAELFVRRYSNDSPSEHPIAW